MLASALAACGGTGSGAHGGGEGALDFTKIAGDWDLIMLGRCADGVMHVEPVSMTKSAGSDVALVTGGTWSCGPDSGALSGILDRSGVNLNLARDPGVPAMAGYAIVDAVFRGDIFDGSIYPVSTLGYGERLAFSATRRR